MSYDERVEHALLRRALELADEARRSGNHPFGALLVDARGRVVVEARNTVTTENDLTGHAELNLIRLASAAIAPDELRECTMYTSCEPCPMCAGAVFWAGLRRVVFGLSEAGLYALTGTDHDDVLLLGCRDVFRHGYKAIDVTGPLLEDEARRPHIGFWRAADGDEDDNDGRHGGVSGAASAADGVGRGGRPWWWSMAHIVGFACTAASMALARGGGASSSSSSSSQVSQVV